MLEGYIVRGRRKGEGGKGKGGKLTVKEGTKRAYEIEREREREIKKK